VDKKTAVVWVVNSLLWLRVRIEDRNCQVLCGVIVIVQQIGEDAPAVIEQRANKLAALECVRTFYGLVQTGDISEHFRQIGETNQRTFLAAPRTEPTFGRVLAYPSLQRLMVKAMMTSDLVSIVGHDRRNYRDQ